VSSIDEIKKNEGFSGMPYDDSLGYATIGYGTKLPLSEYESELILKHRYDQKIKELVRKKPVVEELPHNAKDALFEMAYQMGVNGVLKFQKMWEALEKRNFSAAYKEALDSKWAKQTPSRAEKVARKFLESV